MTLLICYDQCLNQILARKKCGKWQIFGCFRKGERADSTREVKRK